MWKLFKITLVLFFYSNSLFAKEINYSYMLNSNLQIKVEYFKNMEIKDHEICIMNGLEEYVDFSEINYWKCRIGLIKDKKKYVNQKVGNNKFYSRELNKIIKVMEIRLDKSNRELLNVTGNSEELHRNKKNKELVLKDSDSYYYNLLSKKTDYPLENFNAIKNREEIKTILAKEEEKRNNFSKNIQELLKNYPECIKFRFKEELFKKCASLSDEIKKCLQKTELAIERKTIENSFLCKEDSVKEYPDHLALYNSEFEELKEIKLDKYVINRELEKKINDRKLELTNLMSGPKLSKKQLINLRKYFEKQCLMDKELGMRMFMSLMENECVDLVEKGKEME